MIQPMSGTYGGELNMNAVSSALNSEELAFRRWQSRRDAARQQIRRLSRRELQVVQLVSNGLANKSIALELEISVKTIEKHRANASRKLGVGSTAEMVRLTVLADHEVETHQRLTVVENRGAMAGVSDN
jgi:DNA-binding NarL/FixJ family response regulator